MNTTRDPRLPNPMNHARQVTQLEHDLARLVGLGTHGERRAQQGVGAAPLGRLLDALGHLRVVGEHRLRLGRRGRRDDHLDRPLVTAVEVPVDDLLPTHRLDLGREELRLRDARGVKSRRRARRGAGRRRSAPR